MFVLVVLPARLYGIWYGPPQLAGIGAFLEDPRNAPMPAPLDGSEMMPVAIYKFSTRRRSLGPTACEQSTVLSSIVKWPNPPDL